MRLCIKTMLTCLPWALVGCLALVTLAACASKATSPDDKVEVVTTLYPLEYFARRIGGDSVEVVNLIPPGAEAHDFEPTPADIRRLKSADVVIYNGAGFDPWMERALGATGSERRIVVEAGHGLAGLEAVDEDEHEGEGGHEDEESGLDPHVWLDPMNAIEQVKQVRDGLSRANSASADTYAANAAALIGELEALHQRYQSGLAGCRLRQFVTSHAAFGYLARRYNLEQVPVTGVSPEAEPSPGDLAQLADKVRYMGAKHLMVEPNISPRLIETIAREVGAGVLTLHPLESLTSDESARGETYFSLMESNLRSLRTALECTQ